MSIPYCICEERGDEDKLTIVICRDCMKVALGECHWTAREDSDGSRRLMFQRIIYLVTATVMAGRLEPDITRDELLAAIKPHLEGLVDA